MSVLSELLRSCFTSMNCTVEIKQDHGELMRIPDTEFRYKCLVYSGLFRLHI